MSSLNNSKKSNLGPARASNDLDPRTVRSRAAVLKAAARLLCEGGVGGFSVDEVSRRSTVAKTTIYRHWPDRDALVLDACAEMAESPSAPHTDSLRGDVEAVMAELTRQLDSAAWPTVMPSIMDRAERDPEFAALHAEIQHRHARPLREALARARERGEANPDLTPETFVASLLGPLAYRRWFSHEEIDPAFLGRVIDAALSSAEERT